MKDQLITYETAILAKEKGCNILNLPSITQSILQKWLRENYKIMVWVYPNGRDSSDFVVWDYKVFDNRKQFDVLDGGVDSTYEQALEEGLKKGLELI